jgi:hypothetical protein
MAERFFAAKKDIENENKHWRAIVWVTDEQEADAIWSAQQQIGECFPIEKEIFDKLAEGITAQHSERPIFTKGSDFDRLRLYLVPAELAAEHLSKPQEVSVAIRDLKAGDVIKPTTRRYVVTAVYQDKNANWVADVIGDDGNTTSFFEGGGLTLRIGLCAPTWEGLKKFIQDHESK